MNRSRINQIIQDAENFFLKHDFHLPRWGSWSLSEWQKNQSDIESIIHHGLGWDITDFGFGDFEKRGLVLFTLRNGIAEEPGDKPYAEKIMVVQENQETPLHHHCYKREDIINRSGGVLVIEIWNADMSKSKELLDTSVSVALDSITTTIPAGGAVELLPGQSVTLENHHVHRFFAKPGNGPVLTGEVSMVNDDTSDNFFIDSAVGRFSAITEDCAPYRLLINDYKTLL